MARFRRARRAYGFARGVYRGKRSYSRGGFGLGVSIPLIIGLAASFLPINFPPIAGTAITGIAVAPIRLPGGIKAGCQGYVLGKLVQQFTGNPLGGGSTSGGAGWI